MSIYYQFIQKSFATFQVTLIVFGKFSIILFIVNQFRNLPFILFLVFISLREHFKILRIIVLYEVVLSTFTHYQLVSIYKYVSYLDTCLMTDILIYCLITFCIKKPIIFYDWSISMQSSYYPKASLNQTFYFYNWVFSTF